MTRRPPIDSSHAPQDNTAANAPDRPDGPAPDAMRRAFLFAGMGVLLAGCAPTQKAEVPLLPGPAWDRASTPPASDPTPMFPPLETAHATPAPMPGAPPVLGGAIARQSWATERPVPALMNRMTPIRYVTIHHDGMRPFFADDRSAAAARLDAIRRAHRQQNWGDIGYHYAVDRAGNVWECRQLCYQGAHVKNFNPGNVGIVALGNFDEQQPTQAQLAAVHRHAVSVMRAYRVPVRNLRTHLQWAPTCCPGRHMQRFVETGISNGMFG